MVDFRNTAGTLKKSNPLNFPWDPYFISSPAAGLFDAAALLSFVFDGNCYRSVIWALALLFIFKEVIQVHNQFIFDCQKTSEIFLESEVGASKKVQLSVAAHKIFMLFLFFVRIF